ncbi:uncharacterized protein JCM15063_002489 [Sporobolomyces koalae]|uniref:uncharacterized protein n=1 Tax=Sporobolomyces koalae TaxID=500713 RepID=UPI00316F85F3
MTDERSRSSHLRSNRDRDRSRSRSPRRHQHSSHSSSTRDRDRSRSPRRDKDRDRDSKGQDRDRRRDKRAKDLDADSDQDDDRGPPDGVDEITSDDFFIKATELKLWLWEEKGKKLDSLKNEDARRYFKKFCRAWKRGRLSDNFYAGISPASLPSSISTSHSWSFLSKASQRDLDTAASVRKSIDTGSKEKSYDPSSSSTRTITGPSSSSKPRLGPVLPPSSAVEQLQNERDELDRARLQDRSHRDSIRKRDHREARQEAQSERATGRDRLIEKRREGNQSRREFEQSREGGGMVEVPEEVLMGGSTGSSFQDALRERERAQQRREGWKQNHREEQKAIVSDKFSAYKQKEDATMAQLKALAAQRFGPPS